MKKHRNSLLTLFALTGVLAFSLGVTTACQSNAKAKNEIVDHPVTKTENTANQPENVKTETDKLPVGSPTSPTEAYKAAFAARQKKDVNGMKKLLSKKMLEFFTEMGKSENKTIEDELKELAEAPQARTAETRSEKITGDKATLEYLDDKGKWKSMDFVKEVGEWKLTMPNSQPTITQDFPNKQK